MISDLNQMRLQASQEAYVQQIQRSRKALLRKQPRPERKLQQVILKQPSLIPKQTKLENCQHEIIKQEMTRPEITNQNNLELHKIENDDLIKKISRPENTQEKDAVHLSKL
jgi:hypothetical protein